MSGAYAMAEMRPACPVACHFLREELSVRRQRVWRELTRVYAMQAERRIALIRPNADACFQNQKALDSLFRRSKRWVGSSKVMWIPKMNAGLIYDLDNNSEISQYGIDLRLHQLLASLAQIVAIKVKDVVVLNTGGR